MKKLVLTIIWLVLLSTVIFAQRKPPGSRVCGAKLHDNLAKVKIDSAEITRGVYDNYFLWDVGATILVKFLPGGSQKLRNEVMQYAKEWEQYANLKFKFVPDNTPKTNIRIQLTDNQTAWSVIGTNANYVDQAERTMNLDTGEGFRPTGYMEYWHGTVVHEFGHAIGLLHEQSYPGGVKWNKQAVYDFYAKMTPPWDKQQVDFQVLEISDVFYTNGTAYDSKSIMHYWIKKEFTLDGVGIPDNNYLSEGDKRVISAMYPKVGQRFMEVPRVNISPTVSIKVEQNKVKNGLSIFPAFNLKSNNKLGVVYFVAGLLDEYNNPVQTEGLTYNLNGWLATYNKMLILPNTNTIYNKAGVKRNLELFIPNSAIPVATGTKVKLAFYVRLVDAVNNKSKDIGNIAYSQAFSIAK